jgi:hypothetical protein
VSTITKALDELLYVAGPNELVTVIAELQQRSYPSVLPDTNTDLDHLPPRRRIAQIQQHAVARMKERFDSISQPVIDTITQLGGADIKALWRNNTIVCRLTPAAIRQLAQDNRIELLDRASMVVAD